MPGTEDEEPSRSLAVSSTRPRGRRTAAGGRHRVWLLTLLLGGLGFAVAGQAYFALRRQYLWDGVVIYLIGLSIFALLVWQMERSAAAGPGWASAVARLLTSNFWRLALSLLALAGAALAGRLAAVQPAAADFTFPVALWLGASVLVVAAQLPEPGGWRQRLRRIWPWLSERKLEAASVALWLGLAAALRLWQLDSVPYPFSGDEANMAIEARRVLKGELRNPFATGWLSHPAMWFFWQSHFVAWFGPDILGARLLSALVGTGGVAVLYLLARQMFGLAVGQLATALLVVYPFYLHFSRQALNNITDAALAPLVFFLLYRGLQRRENVTLALAGAALGLMQYGYLGSRVVPVVALAYVLLVLLREGRAATRLLGGLAVFAASALVVAMPIIFWYVVHPEDVSARLAIIGIFQSGWIDREAARTGKTIGELLFEQVERSFLAFNYYFDTGGHYRAPGPLLAFWPSVLFALGGTYAAMRLREERYVLLLLWIVLALVFGAVLTISPPFAPRLVVTIPAVCMLVALGLRKVAEYAGRVMALPGPPVALATVLVAGLLMLADLRFYFEQYAPRPYFTDANTEIGYVAGRYLASLGEGYEVYFLGAPRMFIGFPSIVFFSGEWRTSHKEVGQDILDPLPPGQRPAAVRGDRRLVFIFLPERLRELETVREFFPNGGVRKFGGRFGADLFTVYQVD